MMLWDIIRDFYVQYIFGGITSTGDGYSGFLGSVLDSSNINTTDAFTDNFYLPINGYVDNDFTGIANFIHFGDWLSTTATIITMVGFCIFLYLIIRWFFRIGSGLISYR